MVQQINSDGKSLNLQENHALFDTLGGYNVCILELKQWGGEKLTEEEERYLASWFSKEAVHLAAFGIYCQNIDKTRREILSLLSNLLH